MALHSVTVASAPDVVYAVVADGNARPAWLPELERTEGAPQRPLDEGDRFTGYSSLLAHRFAGSSEVTGAQPASRLAERVIIGACLTTEWRFESIDGGRATKVSQSMDVEYPQGPLGRVARWVLGRRIERLQHESLRRLAALVEARS